MIRVIALDSGPLGLLTQRRGVVAADACRAWLAMHVLAGVQMVVPEIIDYELRRELLRANKVPSVARLDAFLNASPDHFLPITTTAMRTAAQLWADIRKQGLPTSDPRDLDVDVILAAQVLSTGIPRNDVMVATSNPVHLSRFLPAKLWDTI